MSKKLKILVVEDDSTSSYILCVYLNTLGYEICGEARSGEEAINIARNEYPNTVIMDINLEGAMNGIEAAKKIIEIYPDISIIFASSNTEQNIFQRAIQLNPITFIVKPVDPITLKNVLKEVDKNYRSD
ncbi:MAG: response regulator [Bacteroidales bacterium]|nr:response regulator [Bacteroidales bacterium]